jgi:hypothetical protein
MENQRETKLFCQLTMESAIEHSVAFNAKHILSILSLFLNCAWLRALASRCKN